MTLLMELQKYKIEGMQEGIEIGMKQGIEQGMEQWIEKGMEQWMEEKGRTVIVNLLKLNMSIDDIAAVIESPIPYVKENRTRSRILRLRRSHKRMRAYLPEKSIENPHGLWHVSGQSPWGFLTRA